MFVHMNIHMHLQCIHIYIHTCMRKYTTHRSVHVRPARAPAHTNTYHDTYTSAKDIILYMQDMLTATWEPCPLTVSLRSEFVKVYAPPAK